MSQIHVPISALRQVDRMILGAISPALLACLGAGPDVEGAAVALQGVAVRITAFGEEECFSGASLLANGTQDHRRAQVRFSP